MNGTTSSGARIYTADDLISWLKAEMRLVLTDAGNTHKHFFRLLPFAGNTPSRDLFFRCNECDTMFACHREDYENLVMGRSWRPSLIVSI